MRRKFVTRGRSKWLADMINTRRMIAGAEVGAALGWTTQHVLQTCKNIVQYIVADDWRPVTEINWGPFIVDNMKEQFMARTGNSDKLKILEGVSWDMADQVPDKSLDFVFIDASHDYESAKKDILAWQEKIVPGGMLCGHDVHWPGVIQALEEVVPDYEAAGVDNVWFKFMPL